MRTAQAIERARARGELALVIPVPLGADRVFDEELCARLVLAGADVLELSGDLDAALGVIPALAGAPASVVLSLSAGFAAGEVVPRLAGLEAGLLADPAAELPIGPGLDLSLRLRAGFSPFAPEAATGYLRLDGEGRYADDERRLVASLRARCAGHVVPRLGAEPDEPMPDADGVALDGLVERALAASASEQALASLEAVVRRWRQALLRPEKTAETCLVPLPGRRD